MDASAKGLGCVLRRRADRRSVFVVVVALSLLAVPHVWRAPGPWAAAWIAVTALACFLASLVAHNHMHCATFVRRPCNVAFNVLLSLARGHTASGIVVPHNLNHHVAAVRADDWIHPRLAGSGLGWIRLARYVGAAAANMLVQRMRAGAPRLGRQAARVAALERAVLVGTMGCMVVFDTTVFLLFDLLPWMLGLALLVGVNLLQHDGCNPDEPLGESRNFVGHFGNWLCFNNGYHSAHHLEPARHWSELPHRHGLLRAGIPHPDLEHASVLAYLWTFSWSRGPKGQQ